VLHSGFGNQQENHKGDDCHQGQRQQDAAPIPADAVENHVEWLAGHRSGPLRYHEVFTIGRCGLVCHGLLG